MNAGTFFAYPGLANEPFFGLVRIILKFFDELRFFIVEAMGSFGNNDLGPIIRQRPGHVFLGQVLKLLKFLFVKSGLKIFAPKGLIG